jgi:hypothetical protein
VHERERAHIVIFYGVMDLASAWSSSLVADDPQVPLGTTDDELRTAARERERAAVSGRPARA